MNTAKYLYVAALAIIFFGCGHANNEVKTMSDNEKASNSSDTAAVTTSSSAAVENNVDSTRKFLKTADLKFKVKNVVRATYNIEDVINSHGGFVTYTNLASNIDNVTKTPVSEDSVLETINYTAVNNMIVRVPNIKLDTTLKDISRKVEYLDFRVIKAEDVALQILSNKLQQKRNENHGKRLEHDIDAKGKNLRK